MAALELNTYAPLKLKRRIYNRGIRKNRIINHDIMNCTAEGVAGNYLYSGRALGITESDDVLQLHPSLRPEWSAINAHYKRIGLNPTKNIIWNIDFKLVEQYSNYEPSVFSLVMNNKNFAVTTIGIGLLNISIRKTIS